MPRQPTTGAPVGALRAPLAYGGQVREVEVVGVRVEMPTNQPIVLLKERDGDRFVPIWIGAAEAAAIAYALQGVEPPRPLTHDVMATIISALGQRLERASVVALKDNIFFAELAFTSGAVVGSRASDAIALALRTGTTITIAESVLAAAGVQVAADEDDEVEKFKEFLDHVSATDFDSPEGPAAGPSAPGPGEPPPSRH